MSQDLQAIQDAIVSINNLRKSLAADSSFAWNKLYNAGRYLEKQIDAYFSQEAA